MFILKRLFFFLPLLFAQAGLSAALPTVVQSQTTTQQPGTDNADLIPEEEGDNFFFLFIVLVGVGFIVIVLVLLYAFNQAGKSGFTFWRGQAGKPLKKATVFTPPAAAHVADPENHFEGGGAAGSW